ncbi:MAG: hypothetical protein AABY93_17765 [Bacteroidota bacterium]
MSLLKYIDRLKRMDDLIRRKATGTPEDFAQRLGIKKTMLMEELQELKALGAEVTYCRMTESYYYLNPFVLKIGIDKNDQTMVKGGQNCFQNFDPVRYYRTDELYLVHAGF